MNFSRGARDRRNRINNSYTGPRDARGLPLREGDPPIVADQRAGGSGPAMQLRPGLRPEDYEAGFLEDYNSSDNMNRADDLEDELLINAPPIRRVGGNREPLTYTDIAHLMDSVHRTVVHMTGKIEKEKCPVDQERKPAHGIWREDESAETVLARTGMLRLNEFTSVAAKEEKFDRNAAMQEVYKVMAIINHVAENSRPYLRSLPMADPVFLKVSQALDSLAEAINPSVERAPIPTQAAPKDYRVAVVKYRQNVFIDVMKNLWEEVKNMVEKFLREMNPQKVFMSTFNRMTSWMQHTPPTLSHDDERPAFKPIKAYDPYEEEAEIERPPPIIPDNFEEFWETHMQLEQTGHELLESLRRGIREQQEATRARENEMRQHPILNELFPHDPERPSVEERLRAQEQLVLEQTEALERARSQVFMSEERSARRLRDALLRSGYPMLQRSDSMDNFMRAVTDSNQRSVEQQEVPNNVEPTISSFVADNSSWAVFANQQPNVLQYQPLVPVVDGPYGYPLVYSGISPMGHGFYTGSVMNDPWGYPQPQHFETMWNNAELPASFVNYTAESPWGVFGLHYPRPIMETANNAGPVAFVGYNNASSSTHPGNNHLAGTVSWSGMSAMDPGSTSAANNAGLPTSSGYNPASSETRTDNNASSSSKRSRGKRTKK